MSLEVFVTTFGLVVTSELGDKSFMIAAAASVRYQSKITVLLASFVALIFMSLQAVVIANLTVSFTRFGETVFIKYIVQLTLGIFGIGLLRDAWLTTACDTDQYDRGEIEIKKENGNFCVTAFWKVI
ncbi:putative divalent cation/proton antiporter TMEM165 [Ciona intestinalis]